VIQEEYIQSPTEGGCPRLFYQYVKEIAFTGTNKVLVKEVQRHFKNFIEKNNELPKRFVNALYFESKDE
jgi:hypothetical protein